MVKEMKFYIQKEPPGKTRHPGKMKLACSSNGHFHWYLSTPRNRLKYHRKYCDWTLKLHCVDAWTYMYFLALVFRSAPFSTISSYLLFHFIAQPWSDAINLCCSRDLVGFLPYIITSGRSQWQFYSRLFSGLSIRNIGFQLD